MAKNKQKKHGAVKTAASVGAVGLLGALVGIGKGAKAAGRGAAAAGRGSARLGRKLKQELDENIEYARGK